MINLSENIENYLLYCKNQKNLNYKTLKAYRIDLTQFYDYLNAENTKDVNILRENILDYISYIRVKYKEKTIKRKFATIKSFFNYLEYYEILLENPFSKIKFKSQVPFVLPKTIPLHILNRLFNTTYHCLNDSDLSEYETHCITRDVAILELLFATGLRVSELCSIKKRELDLLQGTVRVYGKGSKERIIQLTNRKVLSILQDYQKTRDQYYNNKEQFFINRLGNQISEQSVRLMITKYANLAQIAEHITPHMFRHTFATMLLEEDVDIRYIQQILGHSSILTTQIYTHVTSSKQREILTLKHPRNKIDI